MSAEKQYRIVPFCKDGVTRFQAVREWNGKARSVGPSSTQLGEAYESAWLDHEAAHSKLVTRSRTVNRVWEHPADRPTFRVEMDRLAS